MAQFSETVAIKRPPEEVWKVVGQPERWFEGYLETRSRSREYPAPETRITLAVGKAETEPYHVQAQDFAFAAEKRGAQVERLTVSGQDHMTIVRDMGRPETRMGQLVMEAVGRSV